MPGFPVVVAHLASSLLRAAAGVGAAKAAPARAVQVGARPTGSTALSAARREALGT
jgi:hypothetical protein